MTRNGTQELTWATDPDAHVQHALEALGAAIQQRVRLEQLRDQLTGLPNGEALAEWIDRCIEESRDFWIAFIEVDRFKSINDKHGYASADLLLQQIATELLNQCKTHKVPPGTVPFRAHGDEFYLGCHADAAAGAHLAAQLDHLRQGIALLRVPDADGIIMDVTVSVGLVCSTDMGELGTRAVLDCAERAVDYAKGQGRNCVARYDDSMRRAERSDGRTDCPSCKSKVTLSIPIAQRRDGPLVCPNCQESLERPHSLRPLSSVPPPER